MSAPQGLLRPITPGDHPAVLAWNEANVDLLSPLDADRLRTLLGWTETAAVIEHDGTGVGFVLTFGAGSDYDADNFRWFRDRNDAFVYLDRIVVSPAVRRSGIAGRVYDELEARAARTVPVFCLEVYVDPPNEPSLAFHRNRGYVEVGRQDSHGRVVALFEKRLSG